MAASILASRTPFDELLPHTLPVYVARRFPDLPNSNFMRWFALLLLVQPLNPFQATGSAAEVLSYRAEWRLIHAGDATLTLGARKSSANGARDLSLHLESAGMVSALYRVNNDYTVSFEDNF